MMPFLSNLEAIRVKAEARGRIYLPGELRQYVSSRHGSSFYAIPFEREGSGSCTVSAQKWDAIGIFEARPPVVEFLAPKLAFKGSKYPNVCKLDSADRLKVPKNIIDRFELKKNNGILGVGCFSNLVNWKMLFLLNCKVQEILCCAFLSTNHFLKSEAEFKLARKIIADLLKSNSNDTGIDFRSLSRVITQHINRRGPETSRLEDLIADRFFNFLRKARLVEGESRTMEIVNTNNEFLKLDRLELSLTEKYSDLVLGSEESRKIIPNSFRVLAAYIRHFEAAHRFAYPLFSNVFIDVAENGGKPWYKMLHPVYCALQLRNIEYTFAKLSILGERVLAYSLTPIFTSIIDKFTFGNIVALSQWGDHLGATRELGEAVAAFDMDRSGLKPGMYELVRKNKFIRLRNKKVKASKKNSEADKIG